MKIEVYEFKGTNEEECRVKCLDSLDVYNNDDLIGRVEDIQTGINPLIILKYEGKRLYIPRQDAFISNIDLDNNRIDITDKFKELI